MLARRENSLYFGYMSILTMVSVVAGADFFEIHVVRRGMIGGINEKSSN